ncbi:hypothetical protein [Kribbella sp. CA-293567]|uniref:hypothetical protein n=1 Tax=Kribbella sp. CA-293567 TaxID=3002436 RepID=UPI0022DE3F5A|nr:hypothetical protein [Kribbella sp. CA-293567]WBQ04358.1 hypothetical protein OX958_30880 [Kribbella sp. CA-293567]
MSAALWTLATSLLVFSGVNAVYIYLGSTYDRVTDGDGGSPAMLLSLYGVAARGRCRRGFAD